MKNYIILPRAENDYHPLSKSEIRALLEDAAACYARYRQSNAHHEIDPISGIQVRLGQGIRGATYARSYEPTPALDAQTVLNKLYIEWLRITGCVVTSEMVNDFADLMDYPEEARQKWAWVFRG